MRKRKIHKGEIVIVLDDDDGSPVGYAIYLQPIRKNQETVHVVSDLASPLGNKLIFNLAEYRRVIPLNDSGAMVAGMIELSEQEDIEYEIH